MNGRQEWRNMIRDSDLDIWAKSVAWTLDTYMDGHGDGWPSKAKLAAGSSTSVSAVKRALRRLEQGGFIRVTKSAGRYPNRYHATAPNGSKSDPVNGAKADPVNGVTSASNGSKADPRTRSTELVTPRKDRPNDQTREPKPAADAYTQHKHKLPDDLLDRAAVNELMKGYLRGNA